MKHWRVLVLVVKEGFGDGDTRGILKFMDRAGVVVLVEHKGW